MDKLAQKLEELKKAAEKALPSLKSPKPPKSPKPDNAEAPKAPKAAAPSSTKDPEKMAEQLKDKDLKEEAVKEAKKLKEGVKFNSSGQWSMS